MLLKNLGFSNRRIVRRQLQRVRERFFGSTVLPKLVENQGKVVMRCGQLAIGIDRFMEVLFRHIPMPLLWRSIPSALCPCQDDSAGAANAEKVLPIAVSTLIVINTSPSTTGTSTLNPSNHFTFIPDLLVAEINFILSFRWILDGHESHMFVIQMSLPEEVLD